MAFTPIKNYGRKFFLAVFTACLGFVLALLSLALLFKVTDASKGPHIISVLSNFTQLMMVAVGAFSLSNAGVEMTGIRFGKKDGTLVPLSPDPENPSRMSGMFTADD